jgi:hypothetical protein
MTLTLVFAVAACAQRATSADNSGSDPSTGANRGVAGSQQNDWAAIVNLENDAKAIAKTAGCTSSECKAAPVGSRPCGGPRYYIAYCAKTTDSVALYRKLDEVSKAERAYNTKYQLGSTCEFRMPPLVEAIGGSCVAK